MGVGTETARQAQPQRTTAPSGVYKPRRPEASPLLVTDGGFRPDGTSVHMPLHDVATLTEAFRRAMLEIFVKRDSMDRCSSDTTAGTYLAKGKLGAKPPRRARIARSIRSSRWSPSQRRYARQSDDGQTCSDAKPLTFVAQGMAGLRARADYSSDGHFPPRHPPFLAHQSPE